MKNLFKTTLSIFMLIIMSISVSACSLLNNSINKEHNELPEEPKTTTITVYNGETPVEFTLTLGQEGQIDVFTKPGYYFIGAYDLENGETKYFDIDGKSTVVWSEDKPTVFHARFKSIYDVNYVKLLRDENPYSWHSGEKWFEFAFDDILKNAIMANLDADLGVDIEYEIACDKNNWSFSVAYLTNMTKGGTQYAVADSDYLVVGQTYTKIERSAIVKAKMVKEGKMYFYIKAPYTIWENVDFHIKNIKLTIKFLEQNLN